MKTLKLSLIIVLTGLFYTIHAQVLQVNSNMAYVHDTSYADLITLPPNPHWADCVCTGFTPNYMGADYALLCNADAFNQFNPTFARGQGFTFASINGDNSQKITIKAKHVSRSSCGIDPGQYYAMSIDTFNYDVDMKVLPGGTFNMGDSITVYYKYSIFTSGQTQHEQNNEDPVSTINVFDIDGTNVIANGFNFNNPGGMSGFNRLDDLTGELNIVVGQLFTHAGFSILNTEINHPADQDLCVARFEGQVEFSLAPFDPNLELEEMEFSVDIGSDSELSDPYQDGDEVFDPGDVYIMGSPFLTNPSQGVVSDIAFFGTDPSPTPGNALSAAPVGSPMPPYPVSENYFDMDGLDQTDFSLFQMNNSFGPNMNSMPPLQSNHVHDAYHLILSFDDDGPNDFTDGSGSVPVNSLSPMQNTTYGKSSNNDELVSVDMLPFLPSSVMASAPFVNESVVHPNYSPNPDSADVQDDDTDALDWNLFTSSVPVTWTYNYNGPGFIYFSADHEATYVDPNQVPLNPGSIYEASPFMGPFGFVEVVNAQTHLGLPAIVDIDAFEFGYVFDNSAGRMGFALLFSVDDDDLMTPFVNESGGLNPAKIYASFLNGSHFEFCSTPFDDDIDAIAIAGKSYVILPPTSTLGANFSAAPLMAVAGSTITFTDLSTGSITGWSWNFGDGSTSTLQNPTHIYTMPGTYTVSLTVSDGTNTNTHTKTAYITITSPQLTISAGPDFTICQGSSIVMQGSISAGTPPYIINWFPPLGMSNPQVLNPVTSPPTTTNYALHVIDATGTLMVDNALLTVNPSLSVSLTVVDETCAGASNGKIVASVIGGSTPYTYLWSNGATSANIYNLTSGPYTVTITCASGCTAIASGTVNSSPNPMILALSKNDVTCNGYNDGTANASVVGGLPPYAYLWSNGEIAPDISGLAPGLYSLTVVDAVGCIAAGSISIGQPLAITVTSAMVDVTCNGDANGAISLNVSGGTSPYTYTWSDGPTTKNRSGLSGGTYVVTVFDSNSCSTTSGGIIQEPLALTVVLAGTDATANNASDGFIVTTVGGGTVPYSYNWSNGATTKNLNNLAAGWYTVTVTDANNCTAIGSTYIDEPPLIVINPNWTVTQTGVNHTILIPAMANISLNGVGVAPGSYLGIFYSNGSNSYCGGYGEWQGVSTAIAAWGDDTQTPDKDGFANGENFVWKIWDVATGNEYDAVASYDMSFPNQDEYATNGMSMLNTLTASTSDTQSIALFPGWSLISSYIEPDNPSITDMFSAITSSVVILKNCDGNVFWPGFGVNMIGNWEVVEAYQIKVSQTVILDVIGTQVNPQNWPIPLYQGWNCVAYLHDTPAPVVDMMSPVQTNLLMVKNGMGHVYIPSFGIDMIGCMQPGEGYLANMTAPDTLVYPPLPVPNPCGSVKSALAMDNSYFGKPENTGSNMTVIIPVSILPDDLSGNDEIGIFNSNGFLVGSSKLYHETMAITLWGDDETTPESDGLADGETFSLVCYNSNTKSEYDIEITEWMEGNGNYRTNSLHIASKIKVSDPIASFVLNQNIPNPATCSTSVSFYIPSDCYLQLKLYNNMGQEVRALLEGYHKKGNHEVNFRVDGLAKGTYFYKLSSDNHVSIKKMIIAN
jgi:PKD repeat protein